ncbi:hypothetical protein [Pseudomonas sp. WC2]|uniref:hypothetical protein n=1 Tax=Pseudomonas sp. WC2 TaxID=3424773 RepID=UPI003D3524E6
MSDVTFPGAINGVISCRSQPMNGVKVRVGPLPETQIGAILQLSWQGYSDRNGQTPIPGTSTSLNHLLTQDDIDKGLDKTIGDWLEHIKPIKVGSARASYTINGAGGKTALIDVILLNTSNESCDEA